MTATETVLGVALMRQSFCIRRSTAIAGPRHLTASAATGNGASLFPGENDWLFLFGLPANSPHALPRWTAIVAGITQSLFAVRAIGLHVPKVSCEGDICRSVP